jgi:hypothetical protein
MRTLQEKYNAVLEGNFSKEQFRRDAVMQLPNIVSKFNSFEDMTTILKNRGMIAEAKKEIHTSEYAKTDAKPEDRISLDLIDAGIKCELDEKFGRLDVSEEDYEKAKATAIKNLSKDPLYYIEKDSDHMPEPGEKMEKAKLNEGDAKNTFLDSQQKVRDLLRNKEVAAAVTGGNIEDSKIFVKMLMKEPEKYMDKTPEYIITTFNKFNEAKKYAEEKYPELNEKDITDFISLHIEDLMNGSDLEVEFDNYHQHNFDMDENVVKERLDRDTLEYMEGQVNIKAVDQFIEAAQIIIKDLEDFDQDDVFEFLVDRLRTLEPISSGNMSEEDVNVDAFEKQRTKTRDYASTPKQREDGTYDISGMMKEAEAVNTLADILKNKGTLDHLKKIERLRLKLIDGPFLQKNPNWKDKAVKFISYDAREGLALIDLNGTGGFAYPNELVIDTETTNMSEDARTQLKEAVKALIKKTLES